MIKTSKYLRIGRVIKQCLEAGLIVTEILRKLATFNVENINQHLNEPVHDVYTTVYLQNNHKQTCTFLKTWSFCDTR